MPSGLKRAMVSSGLVLLACSFAAPTSASQRRGSTPLDFLTIRKASSPQISPDGETVVFVLEEPGPQKDGQPWRGDQDLWRVPADGSAPPQRWISSPQKDWSPRWSPDGGTLAFLSKRGTGESNGSTTQIFLSDSSGAGVRQLTGVGGEISAFRWAPDGSSLAFLASDDLNHSDSAPHPSNRPLPLTKLYQVSVSGEEVMLISPSGLNVIDFDWSPDGSRIAALTSPTAKVPDLVSARQLVIIDPSLAEVERRFPNRIGWDSPVLWSPDGELIHVDVWRSPGDAWSPAFISVSDGQTQVLLDGVRATIGDTRWSADSRFLFGQLLEGNQTSLARIERETGAIQRLTPSGARLFEKGTYTAHDSSGRVVLLKASASAPPDLWFVDSGQAPKQLTRLNPQIDQIRFGEVRELQWRNPDDGQTVHGFFVLPLDYQSGRRYPMVTILHGGPTSAWQIGWSDGFTDWGQVLAANGYITFFPNVRGSLGAGVDYANANTGDLGGIDYVDAISGVDEMVSQGFADPKRLGVGGYSYGGYLSSWSITQTTRFKAAVSGGILADLISFYGTTDIPQYLTIHLGEPPFPEQSLAWQRSPLKHASKVTTPVLFYVGDSDQRTPPGQVHQMHRAVEDAGVTAFKVIYPGEGHGFVDRNNQLDLMQRMLAWYGRYLLPAGASQ
ncbi:S9 family peptidase [Synechococcus sp. BIOS-E4-1]|uniref:S9 family peptidase n=1 Tax=Synechococcus sp. BIOS-E4-1 TaxID=1400864 RepID=UPI001645385F|nr:S9 family peptidase [Synechococcus sp. BIOS-E4-1]